jgi:hypothetical protein
MLCCVAGCLSVAVPWRDKARLHTGSQLRRRARIRCQLHSERRTGKARGRARRAWLCSAAAADGAGARAAQVILAIDPLFSILLGLAVDRSETKLGPLGWTGGGILIGACLIASRFARAH